MNLGVIELIIMMELKNAGNAIKGQRSKQIKNGNIEDESQVDQKKYKYYVIHKYCASAFIQFAQLERTEFLLIMI